MKINLLIQLALVLFACGKEVLPHNNKEQGDPVEDNQQGVKEPEGITLSANGQDDTYSLINSVFGGTGDVIEAPDDSHTDFGKHITQIFDQDLGRYVFAFHIHLSPDNDKGNNSDRQRNEIKTYNQSPDNLKATLNERVKYSWKFKLDQGFKASGDFTHLHQIKPIDGNASMPTITLTARHKSSGEFMEVIHTGDTESSSKRYLASIPLADFKGQWVEVEERVTYATKGRYELLIKRISDNKVLLNIADTDIDMWRTGTTTSRPKWGIYRRILQPAMLRDEIVLFNDFNITEY